jgi:excisionase family DNA binding protein
MVPFNSSFPPIVFDNHISVKTAANYSGYSLQYLRRLLRTGNLVGLKVGQVWLIDKASFEAYFVASKETSDRRFGPQ